jgi:hypothetical protein
MVLGSRPVIVQAGRRSLPAPALPGAGGGRLRRSHGSDQKKTRNCTMSDRDPWAFEVDLTP